MRVYCVVKVRSLRMWNPVLRTSKKFCTSAPGRFVYSSAISICMENIQPRCNYSTNKMHSHIHIESVTAALTTNIRTLEEKLET